MKGIILAGGSGTRLWPMTQIVSKQILPIYDKPMIYYPLSTLMLAGIKEILIITTPHDQESFRELLGDGSKLGISLTYKDQQKPVGLADAFLIGESFLQQEPVLMILGDNVFHGAGLGNELEKSFTDRGAHIFTYRVIDPTQYGILTLDNDGRPVSIKEKPSNSTSNLAITGLYYFDGKVSELAKGVFPSERGELEITSLIEFYLNNNELTVTQLSRGAAWLDTGTPGALNDAATYIKVIEERTGLKIGCIEEVSWRKGWITDVQLKELANSLSKSSYGRYLESLLQDSRMD